MINQKMKMQALFLTVFVFLFCSDPGRTQDRSPLSFPASCTASGGCDEYVSRVQAGTIDNSSACLGYADYTTTHTTDLPLNSVLAVTITNGHPYTPDQCGIWVDWNRNGTFSDADEQIGVSGQPGYGPYTALIRPPAGQTIGNCTMRVRITYSGSLDPCGDTQYGEVEDYTINVTAKVPNAWTGTVSASWNISSNWSQGHVPTPDEDVTITSSGYQPATLDISDGACKILKIESGEMLIKNRAMHVSESVNIYGKLSMDNPAGRLNSQGNVTWYAGSTAGITAEAIMMIYGNWTFNDGANVQLGSGTVQFRGNNDKYISNYSAVCSFNNVGSYNYENAEVGLGTSTQNLLINGYLDVSSGSVFSCYNAYSLIVKGDITCDGRLSCYDGTIVLAGISQNVAINDEAFFNNLTISATGTASIANPVTGRIVINGNLEIESGVFDPMDNVIEVTKNWTNYVGPPAFTEGTGKVIFNGGSHQYCSTETFNDLEVNKSAGAFRVEGGTVTCSSYDWTAGAVDVLYGTFTANTLEDNAIAGNWYLNPGGTINLHSMVGWVDLKGYLNIYGGNFNVFGGSDSDSYWPFSTNGGITMSGGTLDFKEVGVLIYNTALAFSENITGGTIRTSRGFRVERADFTPDAGTLEFYGPTDGVFHTINGGYVKNVIINKSSPYLPQTDPNPVVRDWQNSPATTAALSNTVFVDNSTDIKGNITIQSGVLSADINTISVEGDWNNLVGNEGFSEGSGTVVFNGAAAAGILSPEVFYNMNLNKTYAPVDALELMDQVICVNDLQIVGGSLEMNSPSSLLVGGDVTVNDAGTLSMRPASSLKLADAKSLNINSGGRIDITGTAGSPATIGANTSAARYNFNVNSGGTIAAEYCIFKNMGISGVNVKSGSAIDPAHSFHGCTFMDGAAAGTLLTINNGQLPIIRNAVFPANTWGGATNVTKTLNTGHLFFIDFSGGFSGEDFDKDDFNLVDWVSSLTASATATPSTICAGSTTQLNTIRTGGMSSFTYLWSPATGLSNAAIKDPVASPLTNTIYSVTVTDALGTTATGNVSITVNPLLPVAVSIAASVNPSPPGASVAFAASPVNGGSLPAYQWKVNGENVGSGLATYTYIPSNLDQVVCALTSNISCSAGNPALSNIITMMVVAENTTATGTVTPVLARCFDATNTITVAGGGTTFWVQSGASAKFIAGRQVTILPTTTVRSGGYMHAWITTTNAYCWSFPPLMAAVIQGEEEQPAPAESNRFRIYPNPSGGTFTLEQKGDRQTGNVHVEIFSMCGEKLMRTGMTGEQRHEFSLSGIPAGLYFVRVISDSGMETIKVVITR
ncbi:MAG: GEVED domain-containing protein [Bacteroidetes bacterium]|nr:GEVED domain-containing protein [Bacteroidota bacterium]